MHHPRAIAKHLAVVWLGTPWTSDALIEAGAQVVTSARLVGPARDPQRPLAAIEVLVAQLVDLFGDHTPRLDVPDLAALIDHLIGEPDYGFDDFDEPDELDDPPAINNLADLACVRPSPLLSLEPPRAPPAPFGPAAGWDLHPLPTPGDLGAWLDLDPVELENLADRAGFERHRSQPGRHYRRRVILKPGGGRRLIEAPKPRLKAIQRRPLAGILEDIPLHPAACGFRSGSSPLEAARPHQGRAWVLRLDLQDFFWSVGGAWVIAIFRTLGYPRATACLLGGLCTTSAPHDAVRGFEWGRRRLLSHPHLPQGAPTSPALANLAANRLDLRLTGLAEHVGARYGRYADDLIFSGDAGRPEDLVPTVRTIVSECGFVLNAAKTHVRRRHHRQVVCGLVVNECPAVSRAERERLEATLYNCVRRGPDPENRGGHEDFRAHLLGRIGWVAHANPHHAEKLRRLFAQVDWPTCRS